MKRRDHVGDIARSGRIILNCILVAVEECTGFV
jgi:hypothetical protein